MLSEDESRHAQKVLRIQIGDTITVVDGIGGTYLVEVSSIARAVHGRILQKTDDEGEPKAALHIALGILHQPARWETFLEKAVELGCTRITPVITQRTQSSRLKMRRLHQIMVSALKQSGRSRLPILDEPMAFETAVSMTNGTRIICHEATSDARRLGEMLPGEGGFSALIGPEGGFSDDEVALANRYGWETVWLGPRRLRAETAAITVAAAVSQTRVD